MFFTRVKLIILILSSVLFMTFLYLGNVFFIKLNNLEEFTENVENTNLEIQEEILSFHDAFLTKEEADGRVENDIIYFTNQSFSIYKKMNALIYIESIHKFYMEKQFENEFYVKEIDVFSKMLDKIPYNFYLVNPEGIIHYSNQDLGTDKFYNLSDFNRVYEPEEIFNTLEKRETQILSVSTFDRLQFNCYFDEFLDSYMIFGSQNLFKINNLIYFNLGVFLLYIGLFLIIYITYRAKKPVVLSREELKYYIFLSINESGKILYSNNVFKRLFKDKKNFLTEFQFASDVDIKVDNRLKIKYENKFKSTYFLDFMVFRKKREIYLVGDNNNLKYFDNNLDDFDFLTGLYNKKALSNDLNKFVQNKKDYHNIIFYLIDIKDFASLNKLYGENFCDEIIVQIGKKLKDTRNKYVYRMENDRFMILRVNINQAEDYIGDIRKFLNEEMRELVVFNQSVFIKFNCAIYRYVEHTVDQSFEILEKLNMTLKDGKSKGSSIHIFDENLNRKFNTQTEILKVLEDSISNNNFDFFYQPQYDIINQKIIGMEALIRLTTPSYKNISPSIFIDIAEKKGLINKIGDLIIENVLKFVHENISDEMHVSINVSVIQLMNDGFVSRLLEEYHHYNFKEGMIVIEITETVLINNFEEVIKKLNLVRSAGISIYIDDFGSGYSSLLYLKDLPIDMIKLDKEFIKLIEIDEGGKLIVKKIIEIAQGLNLKVIAEGVETEKQRDILLEFGCPYIQGYLISKPLSEEDLKRFLSSKGEKV